MKISRKVVNNPINIAVIIERVNVASTFSPHVLPEKFPIIMSRDVLAMKGPLKLPLRVSRAGIINIRTRKLLNGNIKKVRTNPAKRSPKIEIISDGKVSLTIFPLVSRFCDILNQQFL